MGESYDAWSYKLPRVERIRIHYYTLAVLDGQVVWHWGKKSISGYRHVVAVADVDESACVAQDIAGNGYRIDGVNCFA